jgi:hypothetical protein
METPVKQDRKSKRIKLLNDESADNEASTSKDAVTAEFSTMVLSDKVLVATIPTIMSTVNVTVNGVTLDIRDYYTDDKMAAARTVLVDRLGPQEKAAYQRSPDRVWKAICQSMFKLCSATTCNENVEDANNFTVNVTFTQTGELDSSHNFNIRVSDIKAAYKSIDRNASFRGYVKKLYKTFGNETTQFMTTYMANHSLDTWKTDTDNNPLLLRPNSVFRNNINRASALWTTPNFFAIWDFIDTVTDMDPEIRGEIMNKAINDADVRARSRSRRV